MADPRSYLLTLRLVVTASGEIAIHDPPAIEAEVAPAPPAVVQVHHSHDEFPNPAAVPDNWALRSGAWSDPGTWAAGIPTATQAVVIDGHSVAQDHADAQVGTLYLMGTAKLYRDHARDTSLTFDTLIFDDESEHHAHGATEDDPFPADITCRWVIRDTPIDLATDPRQFTLGILHVGNSKVRLRGAPRTCMAPDLRLAVEPRAGHTTLTLVTPPTGWRAGDRLVLPPTDPYTHGDVHADARGWSYLFEEATIASVEGPVVTLAAPLVRDHRGAYDPRGELPPILPHVANLTRNLVIESANPAGTRGHMVFSERCDRVMHHVEVGHLGRTRGTTIDDTTFDPDGSVAHLGTNQKGRYACHLHHNYGPVNPADEGWQGELVGCTFRDSRKWPIAVHGSSYHLIRGNTVYWGEHSLIACEDANEAFNRFEGNILFGVYAGFGLEPTRRTGAVAAMDATWPVSDGLWMIQPGHNDVVDNVFAGGRGSAYLPHGWHTDGVLRGGQPGNIVGGGNGEQAFPLHRGADVMHGAHGVDYRMVRRGRTQYGEARGNEFYALAKGVSFDHFTTTPGVAIEVSDTTCWNMGVEPVFIYGGRADITLDGLVSWGSRQWGFTLNSQASTVTLRRADIRLVAGEFGANTEGISYQGGGAEGQRLVVEDSYVYAPTAVAPYFPTSVGVLPAGADPAAYARDMTFRRVVVENPDGQAMPALYRLATSLLGASTAVPCLPVQVHVEAHQGVEGDDFRLYYAEQHPGVILPATSELPDVGFTQLGGLTPGRTNAQALAETGRCWGGAILPAGAVARPGFPGAYGVGLRPSSLTGPARMAFSEFYCQTTGSNLNAGSTTSDAAAYTATNGGWNSGTGVFTPASGDPSAAVAVGDFASIYPDGAAVAVFVGRVTAVNATTVTVSTTAKSGTAPTTAGTGLSCKVGGAWKGPNAAQSFPFGFVAGTMTNAAGDVTCVNLKGGTNYAITAAMVHSVAGPVRFQGYTTTPHDGGKATIDGGTTGASYLLLSLTSTFTMVLDLIFANNGATGSADGFSNGANQTEVTRCVVHDVRGNGFISPGLGTFRSCEAYACNQSNTANVGGFNMGASTVLDRCIAHDNVGSNAVGFRHNANAIVHFLRCVADSNGSHGFSLNTNIMLMDHCDAYNNGGSGVATSSRGIAIENSSFVKNGAYGVIFTGAGSVYGYLRNCGFGSGTMANTSGATNGTGSAEEVGNVTYAADVTPWADPANGDFRIGLAAAKGAGRGVFTQTASGYAGTVGYPDIGAAQHLESGGGTFPIGGGNLSGGLQ